MTIATAPIAAFADLCPKRARRWRFVAAAIAAVAMAPSAADAAPRTGIVRAGAASLGNGKADRV